MPKPVVICFDLDNTLFHRSQTMERFFRSLLIERMPSEQALTLEKIELLISQALTQDRLGYESRKTFNQWLVKHFELNTTAETFWQMMKHELTRWIEPHSQEIQMLQMLKKSYKLALLSNGSSQNQRQKLEATGLAPLFSEEHIWISQEIGCSKPDPKIFQMVIDAFSCKSEEILFVGDHPVQDIQGASQMGMQTCWISMGRSLPEKNQAPNISIYHILQLPESLPCFRP